MIESDASRSATGMSDAVPSAAEGLAGRLLDAQVEFVLAELSGPALAVTIGRDVDALLGLAGQIALEDVADPAQIAQTARRMVDVVLDSGVLADLVPAFADAVYHLPASDEHLLGDVVAREQVEALVSVALSLHRLHERVGERLAQSPLVATIASGYATRLVGDFLAQNRERAEKLPGVSSLLSLGLGAASRMREATDQVLGDAQARGAQYAVRRSNEALRDTLRDAPVHDAAMQLWDLQAAEPMSALREYLGAADLQTLVAAITDLVLTTRDTEWLLAAVDECVDVFFTRWGGTDLATLLAELGLTRDVLVQEITRAAPQAIAAAQVDGRLEALVRARLAPFYAAPATLALLGGTGD